LFFRLIREFFNLLINEMFKLTSFLAFASLVPAFVKAQQPAWAQCGGIGWSEW